MSKPKQPLSPILLTALVIAALLLVGGLYQLATDQPNTGPQTTMHEAEVAEDNRERATLTQIYTHTLEYDARTPGTPSSIIKLYNSGDNTTIWVLRMLGYGDTSIFVMKGRI